MALVGFRPTVQCVRERRDRSYDASRRRSRSVPRRPPTSRSGPPRGGGDRDRRGDRRARRLGCRWVLRADLSARRGGRLSRPGGARPLRLAPHLVDDDECRARPRRPGRTDGVDRSGRRLVELTRGRPARHVSRPQLSGPVRAGGLLPAQRARVAPPHRRGPRRDPGDRRGRPAQPPRSGADPDQRVRPHVLEPPPRLSDQLLERLRRPRLDLGRPLRRVRVRPATPGAGAHRLRRRGGALRDRPLPVALPGGLRRTRGRADRVPRSDAPPRLGAVRRPAHRALLGPRGRALERLPRPDRRLDSRRRGVGRRLRVRSGAPRVHGPRRGRARGGDRRAGTTAPPAPVAGRGRPRRPLGRRPPRRGGDRRVRRRRRRYRRRSEPGLRPHGRVGPPSVERLPPSLRGAGGGPGATDERRRHPLGYLSGRPGRLRRAPDPRGGRRELRGEMGSRAPRSSARPERAFAVPRDPRRARSRRLRVAGGVPRRHADGRGAGLPAGGRPLPRGSRRGHGRLRGLDRAQRRGLGLAALGRHRVGADARWRAAARRARAAGLARRGRAARPGPRRAPRRRGRMPPRRGGPGAAPLRRAASANRDRARRRRGAGSRRAGAHRDRLGADLGSSRPARGLPGGGGRAETPGRSGSSRTPPSTARTTGRCGCFSPATSPAPGSRRRRAGSSGGR